METQQKAPLASFLQWMDTPGIHFQIFTPCGAWLSYCVPIGVNQLFQNDLQVAHVYKFTNLLVL